MSIQNNGLFISFNNKVTVKLSEITSFNPHSFVYIDTFTGKMERDFSKIIIKTNNETLEAVYSTDKERDADLIQLQEILTKSYTNMQTEKDKSININVTESTNVNIVTQSEKINIGSEKKVELKNLFDEFLQALNIDKSIQDEKKQEILECVSEIKDKVAENKKVPKFTAKSFLDMTSKFASIGSFAANIIRLIT